MTYQNNDVKQAIIQIQEFLRTLQITSNENITVPVDGIYGETTREAVRVFQRENSLPVTGTIDKTTYDKLYEKVLEAEFEQSEPLPIYIFPKGQSVSKGEKSDFVMLLQIILNALTVAYDEYAPMEINGEFSDETENAVIIFQGKNGIQQTGIVNKQTWNALAENYNKHNVSQ